MAVDAEPLGHRTEGVGGIPTAVVLLEDAAAPGWLAGTVKAVVADGEVHQVGAVVDVAAFGADKLAEKALLDHVQDEHVLAPVAGVLGEHVLQPAPLHRRDKRPALVEGSRGDDLREDVLARSERLEGLRCV